jgi:hypothetical protein
MVTAREMKCWVVRVLGFVWVVGAIWCALTASVAVGLPVDRHYEMVSPVFKGGFGTLGDAVQAVSTNEGAVGYYSPGNFVGSPSGFFFGPNYLARRTSTGWSSVPLAPPPAVLASKGGFDLTPSLGFMFMMGNQGPNSNNVLEEADVFTHETETPDTVGGWESVGSIEKGDPGYGSGSSSENFCHIILLERVPPFSLYDFARGCGGSESSLTRVGLDNKNRPMNRKCDVRLGAEGYGVGQGSQFNAVSSDGGEVFFTVCTKTEGAFYGFEVPHQVFVRLGGAMTVEVSRPLMPACGEVPCSGAEGRGSSDFQGASEDGSHVYFTAPLNSGQSPLVSGDTDTSNNLYLANIGCSVGNSTCGVAEREVISLKEVSHDSNGQAANVLGVVAVSPDGSRAYFVAEGDLLEPAQQLALEGEGRPVPRVGAANLYEYDEVTGSIAFIGDLCSGRELSGALEDIRCPSPGSDQRLWRPEESEAQTAGSDGRFLVFATYAQLNGGDTNANRDVYRYDALTGQLTRVSIGEFGYDDNGNRSVLGESGETLGARIMPTIARGDLLDEDKLNNRAVSEDGSRVVFRSGEPLSPEAAGNTLEKAYEWREGVAGSGGNVSLISGGTSVGNVEDVVISVKAINVFFVTVDGLVPQDSDGLPDVYDARMGPGFPESPAQRQPCEGDGCQGSLTNPAPLLVPGSVAQTAGENFASPPPNSASSKTISKRKAKKRGRRAASHKAAVAHAHSRNHGKSKVGRGRR